MRPRPGINGKKPDWADESVSDCRNCKSEDSDSTDQQVTPPNILQVGLQNDATAQMSEPKKTDQQWTLEALQHLALQHNPAIRQAAATASQADGAHNQTGLKPNPTAGYFAEEIGNEGAAGLHGAFVSQTFVRGKKLEWNQQVVGHEVQIRRWNAKVQKQKVLTDIKVHFLAALAAQQKLELTKEFRKVAAKGVETFDQRVKARFAGRADLLQSQVQLSQVDLSIRQTELEVDVAWNQLVAVAGIPALSRGQLHGEFDSTASDLDLDGTLQRILGQSPQMSAAQYRVSRAQANLNRQQVQKVSNVTAQVGAGHDDGTGDAFANLQLSIPVPVHNRNQGNVHAAWAEYCAATQNVKRLKMQLRRRLASEHQKYLAAAAAVQQYRDQILPRAEETLKLMQKAVDSGEYDFLRVLTARRAYFDASIIYVNSLRDLAQADAIINGMLLTGGLDAPVSTPLSNGLRAQALSQQ